VDPLQAILETTFPIQRRVEEDTLIVLWIKGQRDGLTGWAVTDDRWDWDTSTLSPWLFEGWWTPERLVLVSGAKFPVVRLLVYFGLTGK
jgi:hypothetical protein